MSRYLVCTTIAASDPSGGAGIQADIKTFSALGCYATSVITAITVQNTTKVYDTIPLDAQTVYLQGRALFDDIHPDAVKIGACGNEEVVEAIAKLLREFRPPFTVADPVMISSSGKSLLTDGGIEAMKELLFPLCDLITPNLPELERLAGCHIINPQQIIECSLNVMRTTSCKALLAKGGHLEGRPTDTLVTPESHHTFGGKRVTTHNDHGTGCTLSSAIAAFSARGMALPEAIENAKSYLQNSLQAGAEVTIGSGRGGMNHFFKPLPLFIKSK